jgi:hypothetical protein
MNDLRRLILETARSIGANPLDLATAISYETGGTFDPLKRGPTTQHGQHRGLIQFGEPQAQQFGVDWNDPLNSQLGANGAVAKYFKARGFKPGMGGLDLYSTINAGSPGRYGASDANNGGAPGDVRDKWQNQMGAHRQKAAQLLNSLGQSDYPPGSLGGIGSPDQPGQNQPLFGSMSPGMNTFGGSDNGIDPRVAGIAFPGEKPVSMGDRLGAAGQAFDAAAKEYPAPSINGPFGGDARQGAGGLMKLLANPSALAQILMKQRLA